VPEVRVRTCAPAILLVLEHEAPPRLALVADGQADADALSVWLAGLPSVCEAILAAIRDLDARGGLERSAAWHETVSGDGSDRPGE